MTKFCSVPQGIYYSAFFQDNDSLIDYLSAQRLLSPLVCLGDGHPGVWNLFAQLTVVDTRWEILDWFHLKENLYKVGGSLKRLAAAEKLLWQGKVEEAKILFADCRRKQARNFEVYLTNHQSRIVNYSFYKTEQLCSIGSGAVESAIKQIGRRLQLSRGTLEYFFSQSYVEFALRLPQWPTPVFLLAIFSKLGCTR